MPGVDSADAGVSSFTPVAISADPQPQPGTIRALMSLPTAVRPRHALVISAAVVVLLAAAERTSSAPARDATSYRAGYTAAANSTLVHQAMTRPGMTPSTLCDQFWDSFLLHEGSSSVVAADFRAGCTRAVAETME